MPREISIAQERLPDVRFAIRNSLISFPAQVPMFAKQNVADVQWRLATLYLVHGWSCAQLAQRYGVTRGRVGQAIRKWVERAATLGYLQRIPPDTHAPASTSTPRASRVSLPGTHPVTPHEELPSLQHTAV
jgi:Homeodomain-like domain